MNFYNMSSDLTNSSTLNIYISGEIKGRGGMFSSEADTVSVAVIKDLKAYPDVKVINVYINSPGGSVFAALDIVKALQRHPAVVNTYVSPLAASAASLIAQAATPGHRYITSGGMVMVHAPMTEARGNITVMERAIHLLGKVKASIMAVYQETTLLSIDQLTKLLDDETWMTAEEAVANNFADAIQGAVVKPVTMLDTTGEALTCNGVSFAFSNYVDPERAKMVLSNNFIGMQEKEEQEEEGGKLSMDFQSVLNSLTPEAQAVVTQHIEALQKPAVTSQATAEEDILNSLSADARQLVLEAKAAAAAAEAKLALEQEANALTAFKNQMSSYDKLPMDDTVVTALFEAKKKAPEVFASLEPLLKVANEAMGAQFQAIGSTQGVPAGDTAWDQIQNSIAQMVKDNPSMDYNTALTAVITANPVLWDNYRNEIAG